MIVLIMQRYDILMIIGKILVKRELKDHIIFNFYFFSLYLQINANSIIIVLKP